jgi:NAD(P)-dependent dehydrogenase (short-subunit alcohol dehydrogenase family)
LKALGMMRLLDLSGRAAIVTGGNSCIGLGMAKGLAAAGDALVIAGRNALKNAAAAQSLQALGAQVLAVEADVTPARLDRYRPDATGAHGIARPARARARVHPGSAPGRARRFGWQRSFPGQSRVGLRDRHRHSGRSVGLKFHGHFL